MIKRACLFLFSVFFSVILVGCGGGKSASGDTTAPIITILDNNPVSITQGAAYTDAGATALDDVDGNVNVIVSGSVDTETVGSYDITYSATDVAGNTTTAIRTVNVLAAKVTISGIAFAAPISEGIISIRTLEGVEIATTTTSDEGLFSHEVASDLISRGYKLVVTGGQINGEAFTGQMNATFDGNHVESANITAITTLIDSIAENLEGATELEKRDAAIQKLSSIGLIQAESWSELESEYFNLYGIDSRIQRSGGISQWLQIMGNDLEDNELSIEETGSVFPLAHSGVGSVQAQNISVSPGEMKQITLSVTPKKEQPLVLRLVQGPEWVTINGQNLEVAPPVGQSEGEEFIEAEVTYSSSLVGRRIAIKIDVLKQVSLLEGVLGAAGGKVENEWKDISLSIPEGVLTQDHNINYVLNHTVNGVMQFSFHADPAMTPEEEEALMLVSPSVDIIRSQYVDTNPANRAGRSAQVSASAASDDLPEAPYADTSIPQVCIDEWDETGFDGSRWFSSDGNEDGFQFSAILAAKSAYFSDAEISISGAIVHSEPRILPYRERASLFKMEKCASMLVAESASRVTLPARGAPVLLVHGYSNGVMGNIDKYFANFPKLISDAGYKTFSFHWNTNSRFEDSANELGQAIKRINRLTGEQVHIVAHSYGGLLTRTLLQGLAEKVGVNSMTRNSEFDKEFMEKRIASVITVGTPHSGVFGRQKIVSFDSNDPITFYDGRDDEFGLFIEACSALTCHEAGEEFASSLTLSTLYGLDENPGQIVYRLAEGFYNSYPNVPTKVLIGLKPDGVICGGAPLDLNSCNVTYTAVEDNLGDGLISLAGQRLLPYLHDIKGDMFSLDAGSINVQEHLLGFDNSVFNVGDEDHLVTSVYEQMGEDGYWSDGSFPVTTFQRLYNDESAVMYHHMSSGGDLNRSIGKTIYLGGRTASTSWVTPILTEVGLQSCSSPEDCNHSTWKYFKYMTDTYQPTEAGGVSEIIASGAINYEQDTEIAARLATVGSETIRQQTVVKIYAGNVLVGTTAPNEAGEFSIEVEFIPEQEYKAEVIIPASSGYRAKPLATITTALTVEETGGLNFGLIEMVLNIFRESSLQVTLKDSSTGAELFDYTLTINNIERNTLVDNQNIQNSTDSLISNLPIGEYIIEVSKTGYVGTGHAICTVYPLFESSCVVTMVPEGYVLDGGLSAVLTWGENPRDLDSHLIKFDSSGNSQCHTYYANRTACGEEGTLDLDDTTSYGPETTTMGQIDLDANYTYAIHHYSGSGSISTTSQAQVKVSFADGTTRTFNAPINGSGSYWRVFDIQNGKLLPCQMNCIVDTVTAPISARSNTLMPLLPWLMQIEDDYMPKSIH